MDGLRLDMTHAVFIDWVGQGESPSHDDLD